MAAQANVAATPKPRAASGAAAEGGTGTKGRGRAALVFPETLVPTLLAFLQACSDRAIDKVGLRFKF